MVSVTQKSRGCVLLLLSLVPSLPPSLSLSLFSTVTLSLWPASSAATPSIGNTTLNPATTSLIPLTTPAILKSETSVQTSSYTSPTAITPTSSSRTPITTHFLPKLLAGTSKASVSLLAKTSPTDFPITSPTGATKTAPFRLGKQDFLRPDPIRCRHPPRPHHPKPFPPPCTLKLPLQNPTSPHPHKLPPFPCNSIKTLKTTQTSVHKKSKFPMSKILPPPSKTVPPHPPRTLKCTYMPLHHVHKTSPPPFSSTSSLPPSTTTSASPLPKSLLSSNLSRTASPHLAIPPKRSNKLPSPVSTFIPTTSPSLTSKKTSPPLSKILPTTLPKMFLSSPKTTTLFPPRLPPRPPLARTTDPLFEHQPFIVSWNIPDLVCNRYNISFNTSPFKGVATPAKVPGQFLSLFYTDRLGLYPHVDHVGRKQFHGGIPQRANLRASMNKARADINYYIPSRTSRGLAVIDWEAWRPLWDRNWGSKKIYQILSVAHAMQKDHSLTAQQATVKAKQQFQVAARSFMSGILALGRAMRPNYLWGFYLFPNCYNYGWMEPGYTGRCSKEVREQNDELVWLWESSTALYPSVYLQASLGDSHNAALMVRNRVQEAVRVSAKPRQTGTAPVFVYTRPVFIDQNRRFLSQRDLVSTIGESAAVGASGAVMWGASADYDDKASCEALSSYLTSTLNPYITNVTVAAQLCSNFLCQGNGRCVRKNYDSNHYLHLSPGNFQVRRVQNRYLVLGRPSFADLKVFSRSFTCQCYRGLACAPRSYRELAKDLIFRMKQGLYKKAKTLNKAMLEDMQQASLAKEMLKRT